MNHQEHGLSQLNMNSNFRHAQDKHNHWNLNSCNWSSQSNSSSTKRQREDDYSSDGTISSTFSWPTNTDNIVVPSINANLNSTSIDGYPTSSFKRMKIEHPQHAPSNRQIQNINFIEPTTLTLPFSYNSNYNILYENVANDELEQKNSTPLPSCIQTAAVSRAATTMTTSTRTAANLNYLPNNSERLQSMQYSSVNKLLGDLHRNRRHRLPTIPSSNCTNFQKPYGNSINTIIPNLSNNSNQTSIQRRQHKRTFLQTHSSLY